MHANHKNKSAAKLRLIEYLHQEPLMASMLDGTLDTWVKNFSATFIRFCEHVRKLKLEKCIASDITVDDLWPFLTEAIMGQPKKSRNIPFEKDSKKRSKQQNAF